jgi:hypothetical protein
MHRSINGSGLDIGIRVYSCGFEQAVSWAWVDGVEAEQMAMVI